MGFYMNPNSETDTAKPDTAIPDKLYFRIGEVSAITGLAGYVLRFWESEFNVIRPARSESGQRLYRKKDIDEILKIKHLLYDRKFTIQGAKNHLKNRSGTGGASSFCPDIIEEIRRELVTIRNLLE